jgi:acetoacetyl-CoA reductase/3-oxoacyl-[acyl-carrier protein] reductase
MQQVFEQMTLTGGGKIFNIGSIGGQIGGQDQIHYAVSKGGMETLIKSIAKIGFSKNIFSFNISPGCVDTPMLNSLNSDLSELESKIPFGKISKSSDVAKLISSMCSESWNYASGQTINYNGGLLL